MDEIVHPVPVLALRSAFDPKARIAHDEGVTVTAMLLGYPSGASRVSGNIAVTDADGYARFPALRIHATGRDLLLLFRATVRMYSQNISVSSVTAPFIVSRIQLSASVLAAIMQQHIVVTVENPPMLLSSACSSLSALLDIDPQGAVSRAGYSSMLVEIWSASVNASKIGQGRVLTLTRSGLSVLLEIETPKVEFAGLHLSCTVQSQLRLPQDSAQTMCYVHTLIGAAEVLLYSRTGHAATSSRGRRRLLAAPEGPYLLGCPMPLRVANARLFFSLLTEIDWEASLPAKGNITLFVPLDSALAKLGQASLSIGASPAMRATFLRALGAHIVPSPLRASDLINRTVLHTISGMRLQLRQLSGGKKQLWAVDGNTQASIISVDTEFCRGWIHIVDDTLFDMGVFSEVSSGCNQANVLTKAKAYPQLTTFLDMVARAGIAAEIANSLEPLTIFAPINSAYWQGVNLSDGNAIARLLQEHIVHGLYSEYDLVNNATMFTLAETFLNGYADADGRLFIMRADGRGSRVLPGATAESCNHALFQLSQPLSAQLRAALPATLANMTSGLPSTASNPNPKVPIALPLMATKIPTAQPPTVAITPATTRLPSKVLPTRMPSNLPTLRPVSLAPVCVPLETLLASRSDISSFTSALRARLASSARMPQRPFTILAPRNEAFSLAMADSQNVWRLSCAALVFAPSLACLFVCFFACLLACSFVCWFRCVFARSLRALVRPFDGQDSLQASLLEPYIIQGRWTTSEMLETVWDPTFTFATTPRCHTR
jgi:uncharacterized surface protein with fasciclin (FAS1) repeats